MSDQHRGTRGRGGRTASPQPPTLLAWVFAHQTTLPFMENPQTPLITQNDSLN